MTVIRRHAAAVMRKHWENARSHQYHELFPHSEDLTTVLHGMWAPTLSFSVPLTFLVR